MTEIFQRKNRWQGRGHRWGKHFFCHNVWSSYYGTILWFGHNVWVVLAQRVH